MKKHVLIAGGYGAVGTIISTELSKKDNIVPVVAGRNENKARKLARRLNCKWTLMDLENKQSIDRALRHIDIVINCYIPSEDFNTFLPESAAESGIHYLDVAAFEKFNKKVTGLNKQAARNGAALITALGLFPGMAGLIIGSSINYFDKIESADIFFTSGGNMDTMTPLSLQGIGHLMGVTPTQWKNKEWTRAPGKGKKQYISTPFNKTITFYPYMATYDLVNLPGIEKINQMVIWSMSESLFLGTILLVGLKMGLAGTIKRAEKFLALLRFLGRNKNSHYSMKIIAKGERNNQRYERVVEMNETEEYLTAVVPLAACEQIAKGEINCAGAFTGADVMDMEKFIETIKNYGINYRDTIKVISRETNVRSTG